MIQSVLFKSPYSGCASFSGWRQEGFCCANAQSTSSAYSRAPALCSDNYRPRHAERGGYWGPIQVRPAQSRRATVTMKAPAYNLRPIQGPSSSGPLTTICARGEFWGRGPVTQVGAASGSGDNLGLT